MSTEFQSITVHRVSVLGISNVKYVFKSVNHIHSKIVIIYVPGTELGM